MKSLSLIEMESFTGGDLKESAALVGCLASAVGLAAAFVGLGACTAGIGPAVLAIFGYSVSLGALVYSCSNV